MEADADWGFVYLVESDADTDWSFEAAATIWRNKLVILVSIIVRFIFIIFVDNNF